MATVMDFLETDTFSFAVLYKLSSNNLSDFL
jgi:hypothetical protein